MTKFKQFVENFLINNKPIGNIIYKELIEIVFNPKRLLYMSNTYNIKFEELLNLY